MFFSFVYLLFPLHVCVYTVTDLCLHVSTSVADDDTDRDMTDPTDVSYKPSDMSVHGKLCHLITNATSLGFYQTLLLKLH